MKTFNGLGLNLGNLSRLSNAETRSISAENPTGAKGQGGRHVDTNNGCSRDLGTGWKVRPCAGVRRGRPFLDVVWGSIPVKRIEAQVLQVNQPPVKHGE